MNIQEALLKRGQSKCELCSSGEDLLSYKVPPYEDGSLEHSVLVCSGCQNQLNNFENLDANHWFCLNQSMWTEVPAVQVVVWRILNKFSDQPWTQDLMDQLYLEEQSLEWAKSLPGGVSSTNDSLTVVDSNGTPLATGDSVTVIKDLEVKGANFTAKRGTLVKKIVLTDDPTLVEGRVNGTQIMLKTCFLKKA